MKRLRLSASISSQGVEVNMAPLIDCVFLLLIFFIVTTVFVEETGVDIRKPRAVTAEDLDRHSLLLALTAEGEVVHAGRTLSLPGVRGLVAQQMREREVPVVILADIDSRSGRLVELIDECKLGGAPRVSVAAAREPGR